MKRTLLSDLVRGPAEPPAEAAPAAGAASEGSEGKGRARPGTVQQTLYLPPAVHDQLRELAFTERVKMHALVIEGLDAVFRQRGLKSIAELTRKP